MHPVFGDRKRSPEIRSSHILESPSSHSHPLSRSLSLFISRCHPSRLSSSVSRVRSSSSGALARARPEITVTYLVPSFPSANRYRSRSRSCRNITLKLRYPFDPAAGSLLAASSLLVSSSRLLALDPFSSRVRALRARARARSTRRSVEDPSDPSSWPDFHREIALTFREG